jgi:hypothetical protein
LDQDGNLKRSRLFREVLAKYRLQYGRHPHPGFNCTRASMMHHPPLTLDHSRNLVVPEKGKSMMSTILDRSWMIYDASGRLIPGSENCRRAIQQ